MMHEILRVEVGSTVHGLAIDDQDDRDEMGVGIEPPMRVIGFKPLPQIMRRTAWERTGTGPRSQPQPRSLPGDLDLMVYSLRKWCWMALTGNPTALLLLHSPKVVVMTPLGEELRGLRDAFRSIHVPHAFYKFMQTQRERLQGTRGQKDCNRPELIEKFGFDTKHAGHVLRLGLQGIEFAQTGNLTLPIPSYEREMLIGVRTGKVSYYDVVAKAHALEFALAEAMAGSSLPAQPDQARIEAWMVTAYLRYWSTSGVYSTI